MISSINNRSHTKLKQSSDCLREDDIGQRRIAGVAPSTLALHSVDAPNAPKHKVCCFCLLAEKAGRVSGLEVPSSWSSEFPKC